LPGEIKKKTLANPPLIIKYLKDIYTRYFENLIAVNKVKYQLDARR
jgi:hypothetical protein